MQKTIRSTYPVEISVGVLTLIFVLGFLLSSQLFTVPWDNLASGLDVYLGMFLVTNAVMVMVLIIWEEILFPVRIKHIEGGVIFKNHRNKLITQLLFFLLIPAIYALVYLNFEVHPIRFYIWASINIILPLVAKLGSGLNNYNDFLMLTDKIISYKDNELSGEFKIADITTLEKINNEEGQFEKLAVYLVDGEKIIIDLDDMELDDYYEAIEEHLSSNYSSLLKS
jgi:hypothetical protein